ncbi:MAG: 50S ribosomal protein L30 [Alphaproteobacteria bacterium]|nr:50S ribosomal protein L30 [Alphaproteobacteria bacterium]
MNVAKKLADKKIDGKITVKQVKSPIRRVSSQRVVLRGLGLNKIGRVRVLNDSPAVRGMIKVVGHLVEIQ